MSCVSSSTAMTWSKFVCISARRQRATYLSTASVLQDASCALAKMIFIELGGHIHRRTRHLSHFDDT